jgi:chorismate mutase-like protein
MTVDTQGLLAPYRDQLNEIDETLVTLVAERLTICAQVAHTKRRHGIAMMQPDRVEEVKSRCAKLGAEQGLDPEFVRALYGLIIAEACALEDRIIER